MIKGFFFSFLRLTGVTMLIGWLNRKQVMILCYHCVTPRPDLIAGDPWKIFLDADLFDAQLEYLQKNYNLISLQEFIEARRDKRPLLPYSVVLTFDDGKRNFFTVIAPLLHSRNMPATAFVIADNTDKSLIKYDFERLSSWSPEDDYADISWEEIKALLEKQKISIGSHSHTHPVLTELPSEEAKDELINSFKDIAANTNLREIPIAYPHGQTSEEVIKLAESVGYTCGLTNVDAGNDSNTPLFRLNRTVINSDDSMNLFAARLAGVTWRLNKIKNYLRPLRNKAKSVTDDKVKFTQGFIKNIFF